MLISPYQKDWMLHLDNLALNAPGSPTTSYLLIDGVFLPGFYRKMIRQSPVLLFESIPGCNNETRDVSPFLIPYERNSLSFTRNLAHCSGWPMVSVIETSESQFGLAERLAAWCIIEADGQRFNFRFPDTRRLPKIFSVLTSEQRNQLTGPATRWSYIARDGSWQELSLVPTVSPAAERPRTLDERQFGELVSDSEVDEILTMLMDRGYDISSDPSHYYKKVSQAIRAAQNQNLMQADKLDWCEYCLRNDVFKMSEEVAASLVRWRMSQSDASE